MVAMAGQYQMSYSPVQNTIGSTHLHTPPSIFQHMMGQQESTQQSSSWIQVPSVSSISMPWNIPAPQQSEIIKFTDECFDPKLPLQRKRKLEEPDIGLRQMKQFITEEKMAAHFKDMHISSNYHAQNPVPSISEIATGTTSQTTNVDIDGANQVDLDDTARAHPRLILSEELKRLQQEPILPSCLLSKLERPSMALVLWEPPSKHLRVLPTPRDTPTPIPSTSNDNNNNNNSVNNNNNNNNNNESIPDLNQTQSNNLGVALEPMDL